MKRLMMLAVCVAALMACQKAKVPEPVVGPEAVSCIEKCTATCDRRCCTHEYWGHRNSPNSPCMPCSGQPSGWNCTTTIVCHKDLPECNANCCPGCPAVTTGCQIS